MRTVREVGCGDALNRVLNTELSSGFDHSPQKPLVILPSESDLLPPWSAHGVLSSSASILFHMKQGSAVPVLCSITGTVQPKLLISAAPHAPRGVCVPDPLKKRLRDKTMPVRAGSV